MDARGPCPDSALLAAFLDGTLVDYERTAVVAHLAECDQCRAVAATVIEFREVQVLDQLWEPEPQVEDAPPGAHMRIAYWVRRKTRAPAAMAAALLALATLAAVQYPTVRVPQAAPGDALERLYRAADGQRTTVARVAGTVTYAAASPTAPVRSSPRLIAAAHTVREAYDGDYGILPRRAVGVAALLAADLDEAVDSLRIAVSANADDGKAANDLAAALYERAQRNRPEDLPPALEAVERAIRLQPDLREAWFNRALIITALGLPDEARSAWREYRAQDTESPWNAEATRRERDLMPRTTSWAQLASALQRDAQPQDAARAVSEFPSKARDLFEQTLQAWTASVSTSGDTPAARATLRLLGEAFLVVQKEQFYRDVAVSIDAAVAAGQMRELAAAHEALAEARTLSAGDPRAWRRAAAMLSAWNSPLALRAQVEAATARYLAKEYAEVVDTLTGLRMTAVARGYRVVATRSSWMIGLAEQGRNDLAAARVAYEEMLSSAQLPGDLEQLASAHGFLATVHLLVGNNHLAWVHRLKAVAFLDQLESQQTKSNILLAAAGHALGSAHLAAALLFETRLLQFSATMSPVSEVQARIQRATTLLRLHRSDDAHQEFALARRRVEVITDSDLQAKQQTDLLRLESELLQEADPARALMLAERSVQAAARTGEQFRISQSQLRVAEASLANGDLERADAAVSRAVSAFEALRASAPASGGSSDFELPLYVKAAQIALRRGDLSRAFAFTERRRLHALYERRTQVPPPLSLSAVQQQLEAGNALVFLNQLEDQLVIWVVTRGDIVTETIDMPPARAAAMIAAHLEEVSRGPAIPAASADLFDTLLKPLRRQLPSGTLVLVADAPYDRIAFAGLWDRTSREFLVEQYRLVSVPAAAVYHQRQLPAAHAENRVAILDPAARPNQPPSTALLTRELSTLYDTPQLRAGHAATASELLKQMAEREVVHVAARTAGDATTSTQLIVADDPGRKYSGAVSAAQLASSHVRARLVTLDLTAADGVRTAESEGAQRVARALLSAGVTTVIGPVASVPAAGLERAWIEFHRQYATGVAAAESLRRAQIAALQASDRRSGPWATLTLFGSTD